MKKSKEGIEITERDRAILNSVFEHRVLCERHIRWLYFSGKTARATQKRLKKLYDHGYLERFFIPTVLWGRAVNGSRVGGCLYGLGKAGARLVAKQQSLPFRTVPSTPQQHVRGYARVEHNLMATDLVVSLTAAVQGLPVSATVTFVAEHQLRSWARISTTPHQRLLVPDAAIHLRVGGREGWFYVEIVRAGVRGGNLALTSKLKRYADLHFARAFRTAFGHSPVRGVLVLTTSEVRRDRFARLATRLPRSQNLFHFAAAGVPVSSSEQTQLTPSSVLEPMWIPTVGGEAKPITSLL